MRVYLSGKISGTDDFLERFEKAEAVLLSKGQIVINPAKVGAACPSEFEWQDYMDVCKVLFEKAEAILMLKGWEDSKGAQIEKRWAKERNIPILYE